MSPSAAYDKILLKKCSHWDTFACPHMGSELMLLSVIHNTTCLAADPELAQDLNGLCGNCREFDSIYC